MTSFTQEDVVRVAAGLSAYTRHVLSTAAETKTGEFWTPYAVSDVTLVRGGVLTPLGEAVHNHLKETQP